MKIFALLLFLGMSGVVTSQTVHLDTQFNQGGTGAAGTVFTMAKQPDGKILIGGAFISYNGTPANSIARLNADGSLDTSFNAGSGAAIPIQTGEMARIQSILVLPDGKILAGGLFTSFNGVARRCLVKLNSNGSVDTTMSGFLFYPHSMVDFEPKINDMKLDSAGRIVLAGNFIISGSNNYAVANLARLNSNISLDTAFLPGPSDPDSFIESIAIQSDNRIIVGGLDYEPLIRRHNVDGSIDTSFSTLNTVNDLAEKILIQQDGKILVTGFFSFETGGEHHFLARFNSNGTVDNDFSVLTGPGNNVSNRILDIDLMGDKILVGGFGLTPFSGNLTNEVLLLNNDGTVDSSFDTDAGFGNANAIIYKVMAQEDGKFLASGSFSSYSGTSLSGVARLNGLPLSTPSFDENSLSVFYTDIINLKSVSPIRNVCIYDLTGRVVYNAPVEDVDVFAIPFSNKQPALCRVSFGDGSSEVVKVLY